MARRRRGAITAVSGRSDEEGGEGIGDALREEMGVGREERESIDERVAAAQRERSTGGSRARVRGGRGWALEANGPVWFAGLSSPSLFKTLPKTEKQRKKRREKK